jgi:hypothetical protein
MFAELQRSKERKIGVEFYFHSRLERMLGVGARAVEMRGLTFQFRQ